MTDDPHLLLKAPPATDTPEDSAATDEVADSDVDSAEDSGEARLPDTLPILPLPVRIVFPGTIVPIPIVRERSRRLVEEALPGNRMIGMVAQRDEEDEEPGPDDLFTIGVAARVLRLIKQPDGQTLLIIQVTRRIRVGRFTQTEPYLRAEVEALQEKAPRREDTVWEAAFRNLRDSAIRLVELNPNLPDEARSALENIDDPSLLTDVIGANLAIDRLEKQSLLEQVDVVRRLESIQKILNHQIEIAELQQKLRSNVETTISDSQRRAYLREQIRAIQRELGEGDGSDEQVEDLRARLEDAEPPEPVMKEAERELNRLEAIPPGSPEYSVIVTYLETLAELPWNRLSEDILDLEKAREVLDRDHFGLEKVKRRLLEFLAVRKLNPKGQGPILCLLGPPGVGKTSLGHSVANALGRSFARIALGGIRDEAEIRGHRRTYIGAMPGRLIQEIRRAGTRNPVVMLDEIDKIGADFRGDPASALLEVLDPRQNNAFVDRYLDVPFDLSQVIFIATANYIDPVPAALRDRMEVIDIAGYTDEEKHEIARRYLVPRQLEENGLDDVRCRWTDAAIARVVEDYTREAGVRNLEREIGSVCRWVAAGVAAGTLEAIEITPAEVAEALGAPKFVREDRLHTPQPGVVNGLAYTPVGGEVLHIEAVRFPGKGHTKLTGQLGEVMKESVSIAHSLVRARAADLGIEGEDFDRYDVHVHVPAGAVPKDGPSAGIAMFTAIASLFTGKNVRADVAMTGEVTLRGLVLPIGGLKQKLLAASRLGIRTVIIPKLNEKDLPDIPETIRAGLEIAPVEHVDDVLREALEN